MNAGATTPRQPSPELARLKAYRDARLRALLARRRSAAAAPNPSPQWKETP